MPDIKINVGNRVRVGDKVGEVIKIVDFGKSTQYRIAFPEGSPKSFFSPPTEIKKVDNPIDKLKNLDFDSPVRFDLLTRANQLSLAFEYNQLVSLSNSRVNLEPYQVECVHKVINAFKQRFLIADDVGLGKTIEAGMILKELISRGRANRILIVTPAPLAQQWKREMKEKFDENFWVYDSTSVNLIKSNIGKNFNPWEHKNKIITSVDYVKQEHIRAALMRTTWDLSIFDEAHKLSKTEDKETQRYKLGRIVSERTNNLLFLTATPHNGNRHRFWNLIRLIDPYIFSDPEMMNSKKLNQIMVRRGKDRLIDENGKPVFKKRKVNTLPLEFNDDEDDLYESVTNYVKYEYNLAKEQKNRAVGFAMIILQKRMVSSIEAIKRSLERRRDKLLGKTDEDIITEEYIKQYNSFLEDSDALTDLERENIEGKLEKAILEKTPEERKREVSIVKGLIEKAEKIEEDSKAKRLKTFVDVILKENPKEKILIFTEYRDTLDYLRDVVLKEYSDKGKITEIHGKVPMDLRENREKLFKGNNVNIMLATDAAGEGINLQFCHIMINYELPWNPNRIDQRIGRLHRYGQKKEVKVWNLLVKDTREGKIFLRLQEKVNDIEKDLGGNISEVLGSLLEDVDLEELIMNSLKDEKELKATQMTIEQAIEERKEMIEKAQNFLMGLQKFDLENAIKVIEQSKKLSFSNKDIEIFVRTFLDEFGGKIENTRYRNQYRIYPPEELITKGIIPRVIKMVTFDKEIARKYDPDECEFIAFGHPLLDRIIDYCKNGNYGFGGLTTIKELNDDKGGLVFNYKISYIDATGEIINEKIVSFLMNSEKKIEKFDIDNIIFEENRKSPDLNEDLKDLIKNVDELKEMVIERAQEFSTEKLDKVKKDVIKKVKIKEQELQKYFEHKKKKFDLDLKNFERRLEQGEDMDIAIRSTVKKKQNLEKEFDKRKNELDSKKKIFTESPKLLNCLVLL